MKLVTVLLRRWALSNSKEMLRNVSQSESVQTHTRPHKDMHARVLFFIIEVLTYVYASHMFFIDLCPSHTHTHSTLLPFLPRRWRWRNDGMPEGKSLLSWKPLLLLYQKRLWQYSSWQAGRPSAFPISADQAAKKKKESLPGRNNQRSRAEALPGRPLWFASRRGMFLTPSPARNIPLCRLETTAGQRRGRHSDCDWCSIDQYGNDIKGVLYLRPLADYNFVWQRLCLHYLIYIKWLEMSPPKQKPSGGNNRAAFFFQASL